MVIKYIISRFSLSVVIISFMCIASRFSYSFELNPTEEKIQNAVKLGGGRSMDIFESDQIKPARFGNWPSGDGGIVESKLIYLTIISSMRLRAGMPDVSKEEIAAIINSNVMPIRISSSKKVFNVVLKQRGKTIQPSRMEQAMQMPPAGAESPLQSLKAYFNYSDIDPMAKTKIVFIEDFGETEFDIDFSKFD